MRNQPSDVDCAYTAGLIDGEGSICIARHGANRRRVNGEPYTTTAYQPQIEVTTTDKVLAPFMHETWGGFILTRYRKRLNPKWTDANMWAMTGHDNIISFLQAIRPYLRLKCEQADVMIEFCQSRKKETDQKRRRWYSRAELQLVARLQSLH